jgi:outer membrane protein TolC
MDGSHRSIWQRTSVAVRNFGRLRPWLAVIAVYFVISNTSSSADRPRFLQKLPFRAKDQAPSKSDTPRSSVIPAGNSDRERDNQTSADDVIPPTPSKTDEAKNTANLKRFPQKSIATQAAPNRPMDEFPLDLELDEAATPIDLPTALQLAGWNSPEVLLAQQRVLASTARQQLAAAQALPNLNIGSNYDSHTGALQRASGLILQVQRSSLYVGAGGNAVAAGTVNIPGLQYNLNVGETYFAYLVSRQLTERSRAAAAASRNNILRQITVAYCDLVKAQGTRAIAVKVRDDAKEVARITSTFAEIGQGRPAEAERAATELGRRNADILAAEAGMIEASARLGQLLNLESSVRLQTAENWVVPRSVVPDPIPLSELVAISLYQRPEIAERRAEVHAAMLELDNARLLLFSPQFIAGFSDGTFGGGSDVNADGTGRPRFGEFGNRNDEDLILYWSIRNMGLANRALIKTATARLAATNWEQTQRLNEIRAEVADAFARTQTSAAQLDLRRRAVTTSELGFRQDLDRAKAGEGRPIEVLDSLRLLAKSQQEYLEAITNYNQSQYELYVAIGQPPADLLIHTEPPTVVPSPSGEAK